MSRTPRSSGGPTGPARTAPAAAALPAGTPTLTAYEQPALTLAPRTAVTGLRYFGLPLDPFPLAESKRLFTIGTGACDLVIPKKLAPKVSGFHATLERYGDSALHVQDQQSKNGTFKSIGENRLASFHVRAGESFWLAKTQLLVMDTQLTVLRPRLAWCLGLDAHAAVDAALATIAAGAPLALIGPAGLDALPLAEAIHRASPQRQNFLLALYPFTC